MFRVDDDEPFESSFRILTAFFVYPKKSDLKNMKRFYFVSFSLRLAVLIFCCLGSLLHLWKIKIGKDDNEKIVIWLRRRFFLQVRVISFSPVNHCNFSFKWSNWLITQKLDYTWTKIFGSSTLAEKLLYPNKILNLKVQKMVVCAHFWDCICNIG